MQDHADSALDLPICVGVHHGGPINVDVVVIIESEKFLSRELRGVVRDDGV
jgi:hypothetical protein